MTYTLEDYRQLQTAIVEEIAAIKAVNPQFNFDESGDSYYADLCRQQAIILRKMPVADAAKVVSLPHLGGQIRKYFAYANCTCFQGKSDQELADEMQDLNTIDDFILKYFEIEEFCQQEYLMKKVHDWLAAYGLMDRMPKYSKIEISNFLI